MEDTKGIILTDKVGIDISRIKMMSNYVLVKCIDENEEIDINGDRYYCLRVRIRYRMMR